MNICKGQDNVPVCADKRFQAPDSVSVFAASLSQVNGVNVIKLGHKQVVSLIRQGGNRLLMKVVTVTRKPETEEVIRRKGKVFMMTSCTLSNKNE